MDQDERKRVFHAHIDALRPFDQQDIVVEPFGVERDGITFGLVPRPPEDDSDHWWVELRPGNFMAFFPPWDGFYDT